MSRITAKPSQPSEVITPEPLRLLAAVKRSLGMHAKADSPRQLTLLELGMLFTAAGCEAGCLVAPELPVSRGKVDLAWFSADRIPVAVFEFDGRDVKAQHLTAGRRIGNGAKFESSDAEVKVQALYSIRNDVLLGPPTGATQLLPRGVLVFADEELMSGGIERVVDAVRKAMARRGLKTIERGPGT